MATPHILWQIVSYNDLLDLQGLCHYAGDDPKMTKRALNSAVNFLEYLIRNWRETCGTYSVCTLEESMFEEAGYMADDFDEHEVAKYLGEKLEPAMKELFIEYLKNSGKPTIEEFEGGYDEDLDNN